jgi:hypothetical protein
MTITKEKKTMKPAKEIYKVFNPTLRRYETIDLEAIEHFEGMTLIKMYFCNTIGKYVTIPGDALYRVNVNLELEHCADDE